VLMLLRPDRGGRGEKGEGNDESAHR